MIPAFCPNSRCRLHLPALAAATNAWFVDFGFYFTKVVGPVKRFRCLSCGKTFSTRTFDIDYYTKKSIPYEQVFFRLSSAESVSAMARNLKVKPESIQNRIDRLSREAIALHERLEKSLCLRENLVADGFESFDRSQFFPNNINILVGQDSQYLYGFTHTTIRRKGRMTEEQKRKRKQLERVYRAPRGGIESSFASLLKIIPRLWNTLRFPSLALLTDEHSAYPRAISRVLPLIFALHAGSFRHVRIPSSLERTLSNPLFPVNYFDREFRKDIPAYHQESTCFCRNTANGLCRLANYQAWHNFIKPFRVKGPESPYAPHGVHGGIEEGKINEGMRRLFKERSFLSHLELREDRLVVWMKSAVTPMKEGKDYLPRYALG
jgi:hypothetical protein